MQTEFGDPIQYYLVFESSFIHINELIGRDLTIDHVLPASWGGPKTWTNVVTACRPCNQKKADRTPEKAHMPLLKIPKAPSWLPVIDYEIAPNTTPENWRDYLRFKTN